MTKAKVKKTITKRVVLAAPKGPAKSKKRVVKSQGLVPGLLGNVGETVGTFFGGSPLGQIGRRAGDWLGKITGMGSYSVNKNVLLTGQVPQFHAEANGSAIVTHREFIADVTGSTSFSDTVRPINPGLASTFPWLSRIAQNYEQYEFLGLIFEFKSTSAVALNSTNTALGTVISATQYDSLDAAFSGKQQMEAYQFATSCAPSCSMIHPVECDPRQNALTNMYVRSGALPSGSDQRFYDLGNFELATVGMQAAATIGELWVSYSVKLLKPKLLPSPGAVSHYSGNPLTNCFNGFFLVNGYTDDLVVPLTNAVSFNRTGRFTLVYTCSGGTLLQWNVGTATGGGGCTVVNAQVGLSTSFIQSYVAGGTTSYLMTATVNVASLPATLTFPAPLSFSGTQFGDLWVVATPIGYNITTPLSSIDTRLAEVERLLSRSVIHGSDDDYEKVSGEVRVTPASGACVSGKMRVCQPLPPLG